MDVDMDTDLDVDQYPTATNTPTETPTPTLRTPRTRLARSFRRQRARRLRGVEILEATAIDEGLGVRDVVFYWDKDDGVALRCWQARAAPPPAVTIQRDTTTAERVIIN
ncbi:hypothetical protein HS125_15090 [bacterium]|nr:hypothetical protein [bacterium]